MTRKCLIALAILSLFAGSVAQADPAWGVTTAMVYEWAKKTTSCDVYIKVVRWAQIYGCHKPILLIQQETGGDGWEAGDFVGCKWIRICNNFVNLRIDAELVPADPSPVTIRKWFISLKEDDTVKKSPLMDPNPPQAPVPEWNLKNTELWGDLPDWKPGPGGPGPGPGPGPWKARGAKTTELIQTVSLTGQLGWAHLCVKAKCNDPQSAIFNPDDPMANVHKVATVVLTYYPNDPPGAADFYQGAISGSGIALPTDDLNDPDVPWPGALPPGTGGFQHP